MRTRYLLRLLIGANVTAISTKIHTPAEYKAPTTTKVPAVKPVHTEVKITTEDEDLIPATTEAKNPAGDPAPEILATPPETPSEYAKVPPPPTDASPA